MKENTKVVVRMLPANLSADGFWQLIVEKFSEKIVYWYYAPGRSGTKKYVNSRAYIYFKSHDDLCLFNESFNGHVFINAKGVEERAVVEYAPYQKIPKLKKRSDPRAGSIDDDVDYLKYLEKLKEQPVMLPSAEVQLDRRLAEEKEKLAAAGGVIPFIMTPLIEDIRARRAARNAPRTILQAPKRRGGGGGGDRGGAQAQGTGAGPTDKRRASKEDKEKRDSKSNVKARDRNSRRRRDRDERKKKKKDKDEPDQPAAAEEGQPPAHPLLPLPTPSASANSIAPQQIPQQSQSLQDKGKSPRTGLWMIRNHLVNLEPGSITIQMRGAAPAKASAPSPSSSASLPLSMPHVQQPLPPQLAPPSQAPYLPQAQFQPMGITPTPLQQPGPPPTQNPSSRRPPQGLERDFNRNSRGGRRESKKIYTPKQQVQQQTMTMGMGGTGAPQHAGSVPVSTVLPVQSSLLQPNFTPSTPLRKGV